MKLSIVIPANGSQSDIDDTLISVLENRPPDCEILLACPQSYVDPYQLDDEIRLVVGPESGRTALLNVGFAAARGQIIHTLCPGVTASFGWCDAAIRAFDDDANLGSLSPSIVTRGSKSPIRGVGYRVGCGKEVISREGKRVLAPVMESGFYRGTAIQFMHGFDPQFADLADVELGLRMHSANYGAAATSDVPLIGNSKWRPARMHGFRAGQIRGRLFRKAKAFGIASSQGLALLTEPLRNGFGLGAITGMIGRISCGSSDRAETVSMDESDETLSSQRRAA